jgi:hypothetical protein
VKQGNTYENADSFLDSDFCADCGDMCRNHVLQSTPRCIYKRWVVVQLKLIRFFCQSHDLKIPVQSELNYYQKLSDSF